jgi:hypothetical protein
MRILKKDDDLKKGEEQLSTSQQMARSLFGKVGKVDFVGRVVAAIGGLFASASS